MTISIAHLGPTGTYSEAAAIAYAHWLTRTTGQSCLLCPYANIAQTLQAVADQQTLLGVVPIENSIQGSVAVTLDTLWKLDTLQIQKALILPVSHALISISSNLADIKTVYSHPQALAQCRQWLDQHLPLVQLIATNSTTEALENLPQNPHAAAISSQRAAQLYQLPILVADINDYPDNCTRFWVVGLTPTHQGSHLSLAFSTAANVPGALMKPLQVFAERNINMSRIESRPTKRSLGEYLFFIDLEGSQADEPLQSALAELPQHTAILKILGNYSVFTIRQGEIIEA
ncbi:prephenate dehydratase [Spirulina subsalsa FACHB-351]|uniref:Prephenate dehydratase n=1 Tax=Spirulina subsalsa FACHB-351 TaxID=234711 RepID=A0ABT3L8S7_9CYAN|nr:prephenate dehydratase [Spirulina subsalsa]MCW6037911.1 prephenate dehydratase [Spirulina subsalsa FACHB-351]